MMTPPLTPRLTPKQRQYLRAYAAAGRDGFDAPKRAAVLRLECEDLVLDFTRQPIDGLGFEALLEAAQRAEIAALRDAMMAGEAVNTSENRPALHTMIRDSGWSLMAATVAAMAEQAQYLNSLGASAIVSIGIGGSYLGPALAAEALSPFHQSPKIHFIGNLDPSHLGDCLAGLNPKTTAFLIISQSFTTEETLANLALARQWLEAAGIPPKTHMVAITSHSDRAENRGFESERILTIPEGIGGRFSLWSGVGLGIMLAVGEGRFAEMLAGAAAMDKHFATTPLAQNMPVILGLLRYLNTSVLGRTAQAIIPYDQRLRLLPPWFQQLEMESNGKPFNGKPSPPIDGGESTAITAPIIFGEVGSTAQHSFFQMLHQGPMIIPVDFLAPLRPITMLGGYDEQIQSNHQALLINMIAQADALALGSEGGGFDGNRPSTIITWGQTTPYALGRLLALYEHSTVVHGWLLGVNSFDQPGVELGKTIAKTYHRYCAGDGAVKIPKASRRVLNEIKK